MNKILGSILLTGEEYKRFGHYSPEELNEEFCKECGIKPIYGYTMKDVFTEPTYYYSKQSLTKALKKLPQGYAYQICETPTYPDLLNEEINFIKFINVQWNIFGQIGTDMYIKVSDESFQYNYMMMRLNALKACKAFGGGEMMEEYKKALRKTQFIV